LLFLSWLGGSLTFRRLCWLVALRLGGRCLHRRFCGTVFVRLEWTRDARFVYRWWCWSLGCFNGGRWHFDSSWTGCPSKRTLSHGTIPVSTALRCAALHLRCRSCIHSLQLLSF